MIWEDIDKYHQRCRVHGGWLVKAFEEAYHRAGDGTMVGGWDWRVAMAFVPDPSHEWKIEP